MCLERFHTTEEQILARESSDVFVDEATMLDRDLEEGLLTDWTHIIGVDQNATVFQRNARHRHEKEEHTTGPPASSNRTIEYRHNSRTNRFPNCIFREFFSIDFSIREFRVHQESSSTRSMDQYAL